MEHYMRQGSVYEKKINIKGLYYNSHNLLCKKPFGPIKQGEEEVTFRFITDSNEVDYIKLDLMNQNDISKQFPMEVVYRNEGREYWEVTVQAEEFDEIGIWSYQFVLISGSTVLEYGKNGISNSQDYYKLTVYDKSYKTPEWMKTAIVYQIFPDRFFDGNPANNEAKEELGTRGYTDQEGKIYYYPVQYFTGDDWSKYPENPRQSTEENKAYYPNATTDEVWCNEFYGGDIQGIEKKLEYLVHLGVNVIYLNPVTWASSNHKYDATDYKHLDPMFGEPVYKESGNPKSGLDMEATRKASDEIYTKFAAVCERKGIKLIVDGVFNHVGDDSIYFDRYEKYPEIGAYEYWSRVWKQVEEWLNVEEVTYEKARKAGESQEEFNQRILKQRNLAENQVREEYKSKINEATGQYYVEEDFRYINWFEVRSDKVRHKDGTFHYNYDTWWGFDSLPVIRAIEAGMTNLSNDEFATIAGNHEYNNVGYRKEVIGYDLNMMTEKEAAESIKQAASQRWLWMGASGWRLDVAPDVSNETWEQFRKAVKSVTGRDNANGTKIVEPFILGEEWNVATHYLLGNMFDSVMNYQFRAAIQRFMLEGDAKQLKEDLDVIRENYPNEAWCVMLNLVDSHDTIRNLTKMDYPLWEEENTKNAPEASDRAIILTKLIVIFQMGYPGAPTIYYGDEVGVTGTKDPDSRRTFPWERITKDNIISEAYRQKYGSLYETYVNAARIRKEYQDIFALGELHNVYAEGEVIVYVRIGEKRGGLLAINRSEELKVVEVDVSNILADGITFIDLLEEEHNTALVVNGTILLLLPAYTGYMMVSENEWDHYLVPPKRLVAEPINGEQAAIKIQWESVEKVSQYSVSRFRMEGLKEEFQETVTATEYVDYKVEIGIPYYYSVRSKNSSSQSAPSSLVCAICTYQIRSLEFIQEASDMVLGVNRRTKDIIVQVKVPGLVSKKEYRGKGANGLEVRLEYKSQNCCDHNIIDMNYLSDVEEDGVIVAKRYVTSFEPTIEGTYRYVVKATTDHGKTYQITENKTFVTVQEYQQDSTLHVPNLESIKQQSNRVNLYWTQQNENKDVKGFFVYRKQGEGIYEKIAQVEVVDSLDILQQSYMDITVCNDQIYYYRIQAYDEYYNVVTSQEQEVMPKLVIVEVTIRLTIPTYTPAEDTIYMATDTNNWNAMGWQLKKPSGATENTILEYVVKEEVDKKIQYKYTRGSWATEGFASREKNADRDLEIPGNYAYSSVDTNYEFTVIDEGNGKMMLQDRILRWVDMPLMIQLPRISLQGEDIYYETSEEEFTLQADVPFGVICTVNGEEINKKYHEAMDQYGKIRVEKIPLQYGINEFVLHIEPAEETIAKEWYQDIWRKVQATATKRIRILRK